MSTEVKTMLDDPREFMRSLGINTAIRINKPCPGCGGKDRYSFYRDGSFFCRGGGNVTGGDWIAHIQHVLDMDYGQVMDSAKSYLGITETDSAELQRIKQAALQAQEARAKAQSEKERHRHLDLEIADIMATLDGYVTDKSRVVLDEELETARALYRALVERYRRCK